MTQLRTQCQIERDRRDKAIYADYVAMTSVEGAAKTAVIAELMRKYNIHSPGTIYVIRDRVEAAMKKGGQA